MSSLGNPPSSPVAIDPPDARVWVSHSRTDLYPCMQLGTVLDVKIPGEDRYKQAPLYEIWPYLICDVDENFEASTDHFGLASNHKSAKVWRV